jgi:NADPH:quinone reductase-like Zn-dependent oxidoreductase
MKAIVWTHYGPPEALQFKEVEKPTPKDTEVLIRIYATTVTMGDCEIRGLTLPMPYRIPMRLYMGFSKPSRVTTLGMEMAGEVEAVGKEVKRFKAGDRVFGTTGIGFGAYAQYLCLPEDYEDIAITTMPANMSYEEAAAVPVGGLDALHWLRKANLQRGQKVLINGAGGTIGTFAVQLAKYFGAHVTAVDSAQKLDMLRSIGADNVIDYTQSDFTKRGETYDVIFDVIGKSPFSGSLKVLRENGCYLLANPKISDMIRGLWGSRTGSKRIIVGAASYKAEDLMFLKELIEADVIKTVIDRRYPLQDIVQAHTYVQQGHKQGNVIITVPQPV